MYRKALLLLFLLMFISNIYSQININNKTAIPWNIAAKTEVKNSYTPNPGTTGYAYYLLYIENVLYSQLFRFNVGNPSNTTLIGTPKPYDFANGDFANPEGAWKFYVQDVKSYPYYIYEIDTATGNFINIGAPVNLKTGHRPMDMEWDQTTSTMYFVSTDDMLSETQFYSMYWPTKTLTWIGSAVTTPRVIMAGAFNSNGTYFGIDTYTDALWKINKFTGAWIMVGSLGYPASFYQDAGFDRSDYSKMLWCACGGTLGLYEIDTATGASVLIGPFNSSYDEIVGVGFMPSPGPQISHVPLTNTINVTGPYAVNAVVTPNGSGISSVKIYWSRNNTSVTDSISMTNPSGNNWTGNIPGNGLSAAYRYYIKAVDLLGRTVSTPYNAPSQLHIFLANANDTEKPVIAHTPLGDIMKTYWPDTVKSVVTDNWGIDSVWVRWRINSNPVKHLKLPKITGNNYNSIFNSTVYEVNTGDTIYYRIIAQDNSPNHNKDSTGLLSFKIIHSDYACIGGGDNQLNYASPFNTFNKSEKSQMLFTGAEITLLGGEAGLIKEIGFNVLNYSPQVMNGFTIRMQNTTVSILNNGFIDNDWITVYSGSYSIPGTGWRYITMQTPLYWDGVSNVLIEICFGNNSTTSSTVIQGTSANSMYYFATRLDSLACTYSPNPSGYQYRPNICFKIEPPSGYSNINSKIPAEYVLYQNYPNPFNPVTKIKYEIPVNGFVSLKIFDILGRELRQLVSEVKSKGAYSVDFDASSLPSGIYFYKLETENFVSIKRMILIK